MQVHARFHVYIYVYILIYFLVIPLNLKDEFIHHRKLFCAKTPSFARQTRLVGMQVYFQMF